MWNSFEEFLNEEIPECLKKILSVSGYENEISISNMKESDFKQIEEFVNKHHRPMIDCLTCCKSAIYQAQEKFELLPGHKSLLLHLSQQMNLKREHYSAPTADSSIFRETNFIERAQSEPAFSLLLKEFITNSVNNFKKMPNSRRYSEIIQDFSTYIYMLCGRKCYEVISSNLPMPQATTICKYSTCGII